MKNYIIKKIFLILIFIFIINNLFSERFGFIDETGKEVITLKYKYAYPFYEGLAAVMQRGKYGFVNTKGEVVIKFEYDKAICFKEGLAAVGKKNKIGFIDKAGNIVIPFKYEAATSFHNDITSVRLNGKVGFIDKNGNTIIKHKYEELSFISDGLINVKYNGKWGYIDKKGNTVIDFIYEDAYPFYNGYAYVGIGKVYKSKYGYINKDGRFIVKPELEYVSIRNYVIDNSSTKHFCNHKITYIKEAKNFHMSFYFPGIKLFNSGLVLYKENKKLGFIDEEGNIIIKAQYDYALSFNDGLAYVEIDNEDNIEGAFINDQNQKIISIENEYDGYGYFINEHAILTHKKSNKYLYIDKKGNAFLEVYYDGVTHFQDNLLALVRLNKKQGVMNIKGELITPIKYNRVFPYSEGLAVVNVK